MLPFKEEEQNNEIVQWWLVSSDDGRFETMATRTRKKWWWFVERSEDDVSIYRKTVFNVDCCKLLHHGILELVEPNRSLSPTLLLKKKMSQGNTTTLELTTGLLEWHFLKIAGLGSQNCLAATRTIIIYLEVRLELTYYEFLHVSSCFQLAPPELMRERDIPRYVHTETQQQNAEPCCWC